MSENITLHHINATADDLAGNHGIGRYILLPCSDGRAKEISAFDNLILNNTRAGIICIRTITSDETTIDVAIFQVE